MIIEADANNVFYIRYQVEYQTIPMLRKSIDPSPFARKMELIWDNKCYELSMKNEIVHSHYRTLFEHIVKNKKLNLFGKKIFT